MLLFIAVPLVELAVLIQVGGVIGVIPTILLCLVTAVAGVALLKREGLATLMRARAAVDRGEPPAIEMVEALVLMFGGVLLLTPGLITDLMGFLCLLPFTRRRAIASLVGRFNVRSGPVPSADGRKTGGRVIEGEYRRDE